MPKDKPRYLMGVGTPSNIIEGVARGVDFFDCVMPSRNGRHGKLFTWEGTVNILNEKYATDPRPISESCGCPACRSFSRAYIRHLFKADEVLALRLAVLHPPGPGRRDVRGFSGPLQRKFGKTRMTPLQKLVYLL